jgi:hypothetical protein
MFEMGRAELITAERERTIAEMLRTRSLLKAVTQPPVDNDDPPPSRTSFRSMTAPRRSAAGQR